MRGTSRMVPAVALAVLALAGCSGAPEQKPLADLPPTPTATGDAAGGTGSTAAPAGTTAANVPESVEVKSASTRTPTELPQGILETPEHRGPATARPRGQGAVAGQPSADAREPGAVGPTASYEDAAGDAHGAAGIEALSQPSFDILRVTWSPVSYDEQGRRGYSTSITVKGPPRRDGAYVSYGFFADASGDRCELYNILELGTSAYAHAFCGSVEDGTRRFLGRMDGRPVTARATAAGGTTLVGTFDDPVVSFVLEAADRTLHNLSAFTAMCSPSPGRCATHDEVWDWADSTLSFRV